jgi:hypothetical protein
MMSEERRMNAAMIGDMQFLLFPFMILAMSLVLSLASKQLLRSMAADDVYIVLHSVVLLYGLGVGGFALFGNRIAEKRMGELSLLLQTPTLLPVSFKSLFLTFYVKDIIYYLVYSIVPLMAGMALSIPLTGFHATSVLFLLLTVTLTFLFGISLSFFLSSIYVRSKAYFGAAVGAILLLLVGGAGLHLYDPYALLPSLQLQLTADPLWLLLIIPSILVFSYVAVETVQVRFGKTAERYRPVMLGTARKFAFTKRHSVLMAKDWVDLVRSRTLTPVAGAYVGPLAFLAVMFWFLGGVLALPLHFNLIFYAAMIGFFSVSIYGWLNLLDGPGYMAVLPVSVAQSIRAKLLMLSMFAAVLATAFLVILAILQSEFMLVGLGLIVAYAATAYTVSATAYLTGLRTNSYLFSPKILAKFAGLVIPPLIILTIMSFNYATDPTLSTIAILATSGVLTGLAFLFFTSIEGRWGRESFTF